VHVDLDRGRRALLAPDPGDRLRSPQQILAEARTIAVVGASPKPDRPSNDVMRYLLEAGYRVIPVRPADCDEIHGVPCVSTLAEIDEPIDLVDVFRRPEFCAAHASEAVAARAGALWLQVGIESPEARGIAEDAGLDYVENACTKVVHKLYLAR
jgi:predicted CoA-binding protein